jgi:hypothetical protein
MERNYELVVLDRLIELRRSKDELTEKIDRYKKVIDYLTNFRDDHDDYKLQLQKELPELELQLKNVNDHINGLQRRYRMDYLPDALPENERYFPAPITVPQDEGYEIPNGLLGVKRDTFNKIGTHRFADGRDLQQMYAISRGPVRWKDHFGFKLKRPHAQKK